MTYIAKSRRGGKNYYALCLENYKVEGKKSPFQKREYLGTYLKACRKIADTFDGAEKKYFLEDLKKKEAEDNKVIFPVDEYECLVLDPPWYYQLRNKDVTHRNRINYPPMQIDEILKIPVKDLGKKDCVLWLWYTNNHVVEATKCIEKWGFKIKTILTWEKVTKAGNPRIGTGHWLRNCTEHCFLAVRGKVPSFSHEKRMTNEPTILRAERREHSRKPEEFYRLVEKLCPGSKLELFARQRREGWDCWGNEVDKFNH